VHLRPIGAKQVGQPWRRHQPSQLYKLIMYNRTSLFRGLKAKPSLYINL
jgi:hypothetical protein